MCLTIAQSHSPRFHIIAARCRSCLPAPGWVRTTFSNPWAKPEWAGCIAPAMHPSRLADIERLLASLNTLVDAGHTVILIEHHLDVMQTADHVIDLGPEGGDEGGRILATGTPEEIAAIEESATGTYLRKSLGKRPPRTANARAVARKSETPASR